MLKKITYKYANKILAIFCLFTYHYYQNVIKSQIGTIDFIKVPYLTHNMRKFTPKNDKTACFCKELSPLIHGNYMGKLKL